MANSSSSQKVLSSVFEYLYKTNGSLTPGPSGGVPQAELISGGGTGGDVGEITQVSYRNQLDITEGGSIIVYDWDSSTPGSTSSNISIPPGNISTSSFVDYINTAMYNIATTQGISDPLVITQNSGVAISGSYLITNESTRTQLLSFANSGLAKGNLKTAFGISLDQPDFIVLPPNSVRNLRMDFTLGCKSTILRLVGLPDIILPFTSKYGEYLTFYPPVPIKVDFSTRPLVAEIYYSLPLVGKYRSISNSIGNDTIVLTIQWMS